MAAQASSLRRQPVSLRRIFHLIRAQSSNTWVTRVS
jgi:hypothetical protein